ncbi:homoserine O-acetyltransferase family protein [Reyranella soli]|uniref:Probable acyltransferase n=1 Tax=Reyranella soli TaxID=1230389 RepID=A0A512NH84_9HYPH|nr:alpha/beta fold hydrolase [Reyranella soli]GEP58301.1 homoserine O-acetyltransferase [Reyranella soli]
MPLSFGRRPFLAALPLAPLATGGAQAQGDPLKRREATFKIKDFHLESGTVMPEVTIAYETYGTLAPDGRNAVLLTHGYTSGQHMAGRAGANGAEGSWDGLVGPGKAIDTDRLFVVSSNMLGSSFGSTNPAFANPATGKPYGPDFPDITLIDIVNAQKALLEGLGVKHLVAVAGPSFGGYQTFQWGVTHPDFMDGLVAVVSAPKGSGGEAAVKSLVDSLAKDPNWNGGRYYDKGGVTGILTEMRVATLKRYGIDEQLAAKFPDKEAREAEIKRRAETWSKVFDANSLVVLRKASVRFDAEKDMVKIKAKVLYVLSRTDKLFPPSIAPDVMAKLTAAGVSADYFEIDSDFGHSASGLDAAKWAPRLKTFMAGLEKRS